MIFKKGFFMNKPINFFESISLKSSTIITILFILFFFSGCSALIYQVMWERLLFILFGVDIKSTTIIISVFMFGLGLGGWLGGYLADQIPTKLLAVYVTLELYIAVFGFFSPGLINLLGNTLFTGSEWKTAFLSYIILAIPTLLMGATFPVLVTHVNRYKQNIGDSVGSLYFANTLGAAAGAYFSGFILLYSMTVHGAIYRAAILNLLIALTALMLFRRK